MGLSLVPRNVPEPYLGAQPSASGRSLRRYRVKLCHCVNVSVNSFPFFFFSCGKPTELSWGLKVLPAGNDGKCHTLFHKNQFWSETRPAILLAGQSLYYFAAGCHRLQVFNKDLLSFKRKRGSGMLPSAFLLVIFSSTLLAALSRQTAVVTWRFSVPKGQFAFGGTRCPHCTGTGSRGCVEGLLHLQVCPEQRLRAPSSTGFASPGC